MLDLETENSKGPNLPDTPLGGYRDCLGADKTYVRVDHACGHAAHLASIHQNGKTFRLGILVTSGIMRQCAPTAESDK